MDSHTRLSTIYRDMKKRCYNEKSPSYALYGGRGITICSEWLSTDRSHKGFNAFKTWAIAHGYAEGLTIDRIDNNKGYSPDNCRWATPKEQSNNRRNNVMITYRGETKTLKLWSETLGIDYSVLVRRLNLGVPVEKAFDKNYTHARMIEYKGKVQSIAAWSRELGKSYYKVYLRLYKGWSVERALEED